MTRPIFQVRRTAYRASVTIDFGMLNSDGALTRAQPVSMRAYPPNESSAQQQPMLEFFGSDTESGLQSLMDELWSIGVRPADVGTAGHLSATQAHLQDMRSLVAKTLEVKLG